MELNADQFARLGLQEVADLSGFLAEDGRSYEVKDLIGRPDTISDQLVIKTFDLSSIPDAKVTWDTGRWSTGGAQDWSTQAHPVGGQDEKKNSNEATKAAVNELLQFNWILGENSMGAFSPAILEVGMVEQTPYFIREHYAKTAYSLIETNVAPSPDLLFHIAESIWTALAFFHQPNLNVPHGNLKARNVLISEGNLKTAPIVLADAVRTQETIRRGEKTKDLQNLGIILLQLITWEKDTIPVYEALNRAESANYEKLGKQGPKWKELICRLLDGSSYQGNPDTADILADWLQPVRPSKSPIPTIPNPQAPSPAGPNLGGSAEKEEEEGNVNDEIDQLIKEQEFAKGFTIALASCKKASTSGGEADPATFERLNFCADHLEKHELSAPELLRDLEEAAELGSSKGCLRLGTILIEDEAKHAEALTWLEKAADDGGEIAALAPLAKLYESGTPSHDPAPDKAFEALSLLNEQIPGADKQYALAALILRGKTSQHLGSAIPLLEDASSQGYFKASDLLGQAYATGHGTEIDEKRAYSLFAQAWKESKETNSHYYTASNNLGVCLGLGFGTPQDLDNARVYFQQGAIKQHEASMKNLAAMA